VSPEEGVGRSPGNSMLADLLRHSPPSRSSPDPEEEEEEEEEEEGHSYPAWAAEHNWKLAAGRRKSSVSVDSSEELMDEAEKNRLFWEACLAS
jgi:hypothetical protein